MLNLEVYSTVSVDSLKKMIIEKSRARIENFTLHLFLKKQKLKDDSYLFEAITETLKLRNQDPRLRGTN